MRHNLNIGVLALAILVTNSGCMNDIDNPSPNLTNDDSILADIEECNLTTTTAYEFNLPEHFPPFAVPGYNLTTEQGVALGKRLYYDEMLSSGGPFEGRSCSSCHHQSSSFTINAPGTAVLPHTNLNWTTDFLWNGKVSGSLEEVMQFEIADFFQANIALFKADPTYQRMNCEAFGSNDISGTDMANALAQWMRTMVSHNSKFDRYMAGEEELTDIEQLGKDIYESDLASCSICHPLPLTTDYMFHNNGLEEYLAGGTYNMGRFDVTGDPADIGRFKTPTLRNIALTAPYMHDGRFKTLEDVIDHYDQGVLYSESLDIIMMTRDRWYPLGLTQSSKDALVAFLKTFTDTTFTTDPEFSDPFQ